MQSQAASNQLDFSKQIFNTQQQNIAPFLGAADQSLTGLSNGLNLGAGGNEVATGSLINPTTTTPYSNAGFTNPTNIQNFSDFGDRGQQFDPNSVDVTQDPSFKFRLDQGLQALQRSQAATGITGGAAAKAINDYAQNSASTEYSNAYNRALTTAQYNANARNTNFNQALQENQANQTADQMRFNTAAQTYSLNSNNNLQNYLTNYNVNQQQQANAFNRLASVAGYGQTAVGQLGAAGANAQQGVNAAYGAQGNAASAGAIGVGNAFSGLASNLGSIWGGSGGSSYGTAMTPYSPTYSVDPETGI